MTVTNTEANPNNASDIATAAASASIAVTVNPATLTYTWTTLDLRVPIPRSPWGSTIRIRSSAIIRTASAPTGSVQRRRHYHPRRRYCPRPHVCRYRHLQPQSTPRARSREFFRTTPASHGFVYDGGNYTVFDPPSSLLLTVSSINDAGDVVGYYSATAAFTVFFTTAAHSSSSTPVSPLLLRPISTTRARLRGITSTTPANTGLSTTAATTPRWICPCRRIPS